MKNFKRVLLASLILLIPVAACASKPSTPQEAALRYLENRYHDSFEAGNFERKRGSFYKTSEYYGLAWPKGSPEDRFSVRVSGNLKKVEDTYYALQWMPVIRREVQNLAESLFDHPQTLVLSEFYDYENHDQPFDKVSEIVEAFKNYNGEAVVVLQVDRQQITPENAETFNQFSRRLNELFEGYLYIYPLDQINSSGFDDWQLEEPVVWIRLGSDQNLITERLKNAKQAEDSGKSIQSI